MNDGLAVGRSIGSFLPRCQLKNESATGEISLAVRGCRKVLKLELVLPSAGVIRSAIESRISGIWRYQPETFQVANGRLRGSSHRWSPLPTKSRFRGKAYLHPMTPLGSPPVFSPRALFILVCRPRGVPVVGMPVRVLARYHSVFFRTRFR